MQAGDNCWEELLDDVLHDGPFQREQEPVSACSSVSEKVFVTLPFPLSEDRNPVAIVRE